MPKHVAGTREQAVVAWSGLALIVAALTGWRLFPQVAIVWVVLLVFGIATVPQVAIRWVSGRRR